MSKRDQLNEYIRNVQQRLRLEAGLRGAAIVAGVALIATVSLALLLEHYAFPERGVTPARLTLLVAVDSGCGPGAGVAAAASYAGSLGGQGGGGFSCVRTTSAYVLGE